MSCQSRLVYELEEAAWGQGRTKNKHSVARGWTIVTHVRCGLPEKFLICTLTFSGKGVLLGGQFYRISDHFMFNCVERLPEPAEPSLRSRLSVVLSYVQYVGFANILFKWLFCQWCWATRMILSHPPLVLQYRDVNYQYFIIIKSVYTIYIYHNIKWS